MPGQHETPRNKGYNAMSMFPYMMEVRFWSKVDIPKQDDDCWNWRASTAKGYGRMKFRGRMYKAHRTAWEMFNKERLGDRYALHKCDNKLCCNPSHIYAGTFSDNMIDRNMRDGRKANKLTPDKVRQIRRWHKQGVHPVQMAKNLGVARHTINNVTRGRSWSYVPDEEKNAAS